jgi:hypothetical protein
MVASGHVCEAGLAHQVDGRRLHQGRLRVRQAVAKRVEAWLHADGAEVRDAGHPAALGVVIRMAGPSASSG